jgi:hypothetical protein
MKHHELTDMTYIESIDSDGNYTIIDEYDDITMTLTPDQYEVAFGPSPSEKFFHMVDTKMAELANQQYAPAGDIIDLLLDVRKAYTSLFDNFQTTAQKWLDHLAEAAKSE